MFEHFKGMTDAQVYRIAFNHFFLRTASNNSGYIIGNSQRRDFLPLLKGLVHSLPEEPVIFDVGAGSGEILELAFSDLTSGTFNLEEPNDLLLEQYKARLNESKCLKAGVVDQVKVQEYYDANRMRPESITENSQDLILAIHMIYHLSDFHCQSDISPDKDIKQFMAFIYSRLKPGGHIFLVYADQEQSVAGYASKHYYETLPKGQKTAENLRDIFKARNRLLKDGAINEWLESQFPDTLPTWKAKVTPSCIYGNSIDELAVMSVVGELCSPENDLFEINKLVAAKEALQKNEKALGITIEEKNIPQRGMLRGNEPQVVVIIGKQPKA